MTRTRHSGQPPGSGRRREGHAQTPAGRPRRGWRRAVGRRTPTRQGPMAPGRGRRHRPGGRGRRRSAGPPPASAVVLLVARGHVGDRSNSIAIVTGRRPALAELVGTSRGTVLAQTAARPRSPATAKTEVDEAAEMNRAAMESISLASRCSQHDAPAGRGGWRTVRRTNVVTAPPAAGRRPRLMSTTRPGGGDGLHGALRRAPSLPSVVVRPTTLAGWTGCRRSGQARKPSDLQPAPSGRVVGPPRPHDTAAWPAQVRAWLDV